MIEFILFAIWVVGILAFAFFTFFPNLGAKVWVKFIQPIINFYNNLKNPS